MADKYEKDFSQVVAATPLSHYIRTVNATTDVSGLATLPVLAPAIAETLYDLGLICSDTELDDLKSKLGL